MLQARVEGDWSRVVGIDMVLKCAGLDLDLPNEKDFHASMKGKRSRA